MKRNSLPWFCFAIISLMIFPLIGCGGGGGGDGWDPPQVQPQPPVTQPTADINVSPTQQAFGDVVVDRSSDQTITVQNTGTGSLNVGQIAKAILSSGPFSLLNDTCSGQSVAPGGTCTFQIRFSPSSEGASNDVFNIPSNDPDENPVAVNVTGYGRSLYVSLNEIDKTSCPRIKLLMNVNYKNSPLTGLTKTNLSLLENSAAKTIETFGSYTEPISVALAMDYSDSMFDNNLIVPMQEAAKSFIDRMNLAIQDEAAIIKFSDSYLLIDPPGWTTNQNDLKTAIDSSFSKGATALYNTLSYAIDQVAARTKRKAIVLISDGGDTVGGTTLDQVLAKAKGTNIPIFTIGLGVNDADKATLLQLANETGGQYYFAPTASDLNTIYLQIAEILVGQYTLEYMSQSSGGGSITLDVEVNYNNGSSIMTGKATKSFTGCP
jgi:VWFA-related protein